MHMRAADSVLLSLLASAGLLAGARPVLATPDRSGDPGQLYAAACLACHGSDGRGLPEDDPRLPDFETPPPDLRDPIFSSTEPKRDWEQVVAHGGPAMGLSPQMPAFGEGLSGAEISALVDYAKSFARPESDRYASGEMNLLRPHLA